MWSIRANMRRMSLSHWFEALVGPYLAAGLRARPAVHLDDVGREVVVAAQQRRAHAVGVDWHAALLEGRDLVDGEATGDDDAHALVAGGVERLADLLDQLRLHAAQVGP